MNYCGLSLTDRMSTPIRTMVLATLLAMNASAAQAQSKAPEATPPINAAATQPSMQPSTAIDLVLHPATAQPSTPIDLTLPPATAQPSTPIDLTLHPATAPPAGPVGFSLESASEEVKRVARWVIDSKDNGGMPFLVVDKVNAQVLAFNRAGQFQGATPALLGMASGDRLLAPNTATMEQMPPQVRITPAGRFVSRLAIDSHGKELLVLDYDASISLHPVVKGTPKERRAERLRSATVQDNRISFGCINVPATFYSTVVSPSFTGTKGIVYVLPETSPAGQLFGFNPAGAAVTGAQPGSPTVNGRAAPTVPAPDAR